MRWHRYITINLPWFGLTMVSGSMTPLILPFLVQQFVPAATKNTALGDIRFFSLMVALLVQPLGGLLSDRSMSRWGRRRPYILLGAALTALLVLSLRWVESYAALFAVVLLMQATVNLAHGAVLGLIPDLIPPKRRGVASGVKAAMEVAPLVVISLVIGRMLDGGRLGAATRLVSGVLLGTVLVMALATRERPLVRRPDLPLWGPLWRVAALTLTFLGTVWGFRWLLLAAGRWLGADGLAVLAGLGAAGLIAVVGAIVLGVWASVRVGVGPASRKQPAFAWWVINRLLFLAAVGIVQSCALYFVQDVLGLPNAATVTGQVMLAVGISTLAGALGSGFAADRWGRKPLLAAAGGLAALGALLLTLARGLPLAYVSAGMIGLGAGVFMATNWALGTDLAPADESGRFLGIANLAGAGAGAVASAIGGPLADLINAQRAGLGYLVLFAIAVACFALSVAILRRIPEGYRMKA